LRSSATRSRSRRIPYRNPLRRQTRHARGSPLAQPPDDRAPDCRQTIARQMSPGSRQHFGDQAAGRYSAEPPDRNQENAAVPMAPSVLTSADMASLSFSPARREIRAGQFSRFPASRWQAAVLEDCVSNREIAKRDESRKLWDGLARPFGARTWAGERCAIAVSAHSFAIRRNIMLCVFGTQTDQNRLALRLMPTTWEGSHTCGEKRETKGYQALKSNDPANR
jgi:hypothetical protein